MKSVLAVLVRSPRWQQGRQKTVTPLFLELREGPVIIGKAGTWSGAREGVTGVDPEQEDCPQNTTAVLPVHSLKCANRFSRLYRLHGRGPRERRLLRAQVTFNYEHGALCLKCSVLPFPSKILPVTLAAELWVRGILLLNQIQDCNAPASSLSKENPRGPG